MPVSMKDLIGKRFEALITQGSSLVQGLPAGYKGVGLEYYVPERSIPNYQAWLSAVANLLSVVAPSDSAYLAELDRQLKHEHMSNGVVSSVVQKVHGLLTSAYNDWQAGLLGQLEYQVAGLTFDDFLDHAGEYHRAGKLMEAGILASVVFEDTVKKIAARRNVSLAGLTLDPAIDTLVKATVITPVKAKQLRAMAGVRNEALHANWLALDESNVEMLILGVRGLIQAYLT
jgi:hypothetical protein